MADLDFVIGWSGSAASRGFRDLASQAKDAGSQFKTLKATAEAAGNTLKKSQHNAAAAARRVGIEEQKLSELRATGKAKLSQMLAAEDRVASARRRSADATEEVERATKDLQQAQERLNDSSKRTSRGLSLLNKGTGAAGKGISVAGKGFKTLGLAAGGAAIAGVAAFSAVGAAGAVMGVKVASGNEQAKISFTTMLGSATKADKFLRNLQKFAAETPFEFPELQTAASSLISAGINANKVVPIMRTLGDVTSGMGTGSEGVQRATVALQQMSAAGRITGEDLNQLRDAGIPVYDLLAKATGKSKEEVVKLAQAGKLGKKELGQMMKALEDGKGLERFNGLMEKQSKSLAGTWSTLKDTIGQGLGNVMSNSLPILKQGITGISNLATSAFGWVDKNKGSIGALFKTAGSSISAFGRIAAGVFSAFIGSTGDGTASFKKFAQYISTNQEAIVSTFVSAGKSALLFGRTLATSASTGLRAFAGLLDGITSGTEGVLSLIGSIAAGSAAAFGWIPGLGPKLKGAVAGFNEFSKSAVDGSRKAANGARGLADGIDKNVVPAIDKGAAALDKFGNKEIVKARQRDQVAKFAIELKKIPKEKRAEITSIFKKKGAVEAYAAMARIKDKAVIAKATSKGTNTVKEMDSALKKLRDRRVAAIARQAGKKEVQALDAAIESVHNKRVQVTANASGRGEIASLQNSINRVHGKTVWVTVKKRGGGVTVDAKGGTMGRQYLADGGTIRGMGGPRQDNIATVDRESGVQLAWTSVGEELINARQSELNRRQLKQINAGGKWDLVPRRADGGTMGTRDLVGAGARGGATIVNHYTINAPNYVGPQSELVKAVVDLKRQNRWPG